MPAVLVGGFMEERALRNAVRKHDRLHDLRVFARLPDPKA